ncbi:sigma 54-interacting transcriptional regulator [Virgibacillus sp. C22-A2]|uniref:Sigma 54-interacting transcriptional regulator n=1 Tax=Virgibacillus tibetensis TaxID=3042313 RepID=A0ABU6KD49_9BACI|nr:sigma 54-interacting transcriptional regulator [Virgibacillus sp. C22-A2]
MNSNPTKDILSLSAMNELYKDLLDKVDVGIHVINEKGKTIIYNKKMMEIESMEGDDVLDKNLLDVFKFHDKQNSTLVQALKEGKSTKHVKQTYFNNKGKEITTINDSFPILNAGKITGAVEIAKDITQLEHIIKENVLRKQNTKFTFDQIIGESDVIQSVIEESKRATRTSSSVLIVGETGTGKELFAQSIHNGSNRSGASFISQNCAAIPDSLMESLLFGTKKGAFTGAVDRPGLFEQADGGTLLLDEINSLDPSLQAKLLRVIQEKTIRRVGDMKDKEVDVRIIATINEDPVDAVANNRLRKDLYYRLSVVTLFIPPLRERKKDLSLLSQRFIEKYNALFQMDVKKISEEAMHILYQHDWPGNVRELEHTIEGTMNLIMDEKIICVQDLPVIFRKKYKMNEGLYSHKGMPAIAESGGDSRSLRDKVAEAEKHYIRQVLEENNNNISHTAKILGISRQSLQYRMKKFGL